MRIGIVAGWGNYPLVVAERLAQRGYQVYGLGIKDHVDARFRSHCHRFQQVGLGQLGSAVRFFRRHDVPCATMAGKIHKVRLFERFHWWHHFPDLYCIKTFYPHFVSLAQNRQDDTLLRAIVDAFARRGVALCPATDLVPELLVPADHLCGEPISARRWKDVVYGWKLAKEMGRLDVGQSVAVKGQAVLAVEAVEGTDACIRRAGSLCPAGGFTVVKVAKPQQDMRFDVPTVGINTVKTMHEVGADLLVMEADKTILLERESLLELANQYKITVVALRHAPEEGTDRR